MCYVSSIECIPLSDNRSEPARSTILSTEYLVPKLKCMTSSTFSSVTLFPSFDLFSRSILKIVCDLDECSWTSVYL